MIRPGSCACVPLGDEQSRDMLRAHESFGSMGPCTAPRSSTSRNSSRRPSEYPWFFKCFLYTAMQFFSDSNTPEPGFIGPVGSLGEIVRAASSASSTPGAQTDPVSGHWPRVSPSKPSEAREPRKEPWPEWPNQEKFASSEH